MIWQTTLKRWLILKSASNFSRVILSLQLLSQNTVFLYNHHLLLITFEIWNHKFTLFGHVLGSLTPWATWNLNIHQTDCTLDFAKIHLCLKARKILCQTCGWFIEENYIAFSTGLCTLDMKKNKTITRCLTGDPVIYFSDKML